MKKQSKLIQIMDKTSHNFNTPPKTIPAQWVQMFQQATRIAAITLSIIITITPT